MSRIPQLEKLLSVDPTDADVMYMLAQEHVNQGDLAGAVTWFDKCIAQDGVYAYAYYHKAKALEGLGEMEQATDTLRLGLEQAKSTGDAKAIGEIEEYLNQIG